MGGAQSTEAAAAPAATNGTSGNGGGNNSRRDVYANLERRDSEDDDCEVCSLLSFCNPKRTNHQTERKKKKTPSDLLGTPILTPRLGDRRKQRNDGTNGNPTLFMSRYGGLEKEPSADVDFDGDAGDGTGGWERSPSAVVHEGSVSTDYCSSVCMHVS
jgi:hypothetical protein